MIWSCPHSDTSLAHEPFRLQLWTEDVRWATHNRLDIDCSQPFYANLFKSSKLSRSDASVNVRWTFWCLKAFKDIIFKEWRAVIAAELKSVQWKKKKKKTGLGRLRASTRWQVAELVWASLTPSSTITAFICSSQPSSPIHNCLPSHLALMWCASAHTLRSLYFWKYL